MQSDCRLNMSFRPCNLYGFHSGPKVFIILKGPAVIHLNTLYRHQKKFVIARDIDG